MNEFKNRVIRISNIPNDEVIYKVNSKPIFSLVLLAIIGIFLLFSRFWMFGVLFAFFSVYALVFIPNRILMQFTARFMVSFQDQNKQECIIVYWNEITQWEYRITRKSTDFLILLLNDGANMNLPVLYPDKVIKILLKYAAEKGVKTQDTKRFFNR